MNVRRLLFPIALLTSITVSTMLGNHVGAQEVVVIPAPPEPDRVSLFDSADDADYSSHSSMQRTRLSPRELRTARAIHQANQRMARMEYNLWMGHEPLRPRWNSIPMMSSRYSQPTFYVPVYIYSR
jgi:hypothetical protein